MRQGFAHLEVAVHPPGRLFLTCDLGRLTYGDLASAPAPDVSGQVQVEPDRSIEAVVALVTTPGPERQMVLLDPTLPADEKKRRIEAAEPARYREAATVLFTSGTTGAAKAVRLTERNWSAAMRASALHLDHRSDDVWLAAMPFHHVGGLSILYRSAHVGSEVLWLPSFETAAVAEALRGRVTIASLVPTMLGRVLDHDHRPFRGLRAVLVGGGPIPDGLLEEAAGRGLPVLPTYGMTETCAQVATLRPGEPLRKAAHPLPGVEVGITEEGRIRVRGEQVSPGYADEDDRSDDAWFTTPDFGRVEPDGALVVTGRADRVIVSGGENVDPARVEAALLAHPGVEEAAVVGLEDDDWGTAVAAGYRGDVEPGALRDWARSRLAPHERPKVLRRFERLPLLGPGKPDLESIRTLLTH